MFQNSIDIKLGDGHLALFWTDRWNGGDSPCIAALDLCRFVDQTTNQEEQDGGASATAASVDSGHPRKAHDPITTAMYSASWQLQEATWR